MIGSGPETTLRILYTFQMEMQVGSGDDELTRSVREWIAAWGAQVAAVEMAEARARFAPDVVSFGTATDIVVGIDQLHAQQWSAVWPTIRGFAFDVDAAVVLPSPDGLQAVAVVPWTSEGTSSDGAAGDEWFVRPGRATVVLARASSDAPWFGTHTHFSLVPVPRR